MKAVARKTFPKISFLACLLLVLCLLRFILAAFLPLSPDEAYYWLWSRHFQSGYFDHPFMVALWIRFGTFLWGDTPFGVRFLGPLSGVLDTMLLMMTARQLYRRDERRASYCALLLNGTIMFGFGMIIMTPDTPLLFFTILTLWAFIKVLVTKGRRASVFWWSMTGVSLGLAFDSKYTACFLVAGIGFYILIYRRDFLRQPAPWLGGGLALLTVSPVLVWNAHHHWAGLLKQGTRVGDWHPERALTFISELIGGQIGLATPLIAVVCFAGFLKARKEIPFLFCMILPGLVVLLLHACGGRVQANWPAVLYPAFILAGGLIARARYQVIGSALICLLGLALQGLYAPLPLSAHWDPIARQTRGWSGLTHSVIAQAEAMQAQALFVPDYALASILAYHDRQGFPIISPDQRWSFLEGHAERGAIKVLQVTEKRKISSREERAADRIFRNRVLRSYHLEEQSAVRGYHVR